MSNLFVKLCDFIYNKNMKRLFLLILSFIFLGGAVSGSAFYIHSSLNAVETSGGGGNSQSDILENDEVTANADMSRAVTVSFNSMGGSSVASDTFIVGDYYYKSNLYDPNNTNRNSAITLSNNIFTVNYSSSRNAWLNFNQPYSEEAFAPNITYTIV